MATPSSRFQLVVFDVAGTTVDDGDAVLDCLKAAVDPYVSVSSQDVRGVMGLPKPVAIRKLLLQHRSMPDEARDQAVEHAHRDFRAAVITRYREDPDIKPMPGVLAVFRALRQAGILIALDTGFNRDILDAVLSRLEWATDGSLAASVSSDEVARGRPYPDLIEKAMALTGVADPAKVVKVGDTPVDIMEGLAAGCGLVVGVSYGTHSRAELERDGVHVVDALPDLLPLLGLEPA
jgi:phosphonatase-like hydrolase